MGAKPAETAAADPPDDPPGTLDRSQGFLVSKKAEFSVEEPMANSSIFSLPITIPPFSLTFTVAEASYGGIKSSRIFDEQVVFKPFVAILSLSPTGKPSNNLSS